MTAVVFEHNIGFEGNVGLTFSVTSAKCSLTFLFVADARAGRVARSLVTAASPRAAARTHRGCLSVAARG
jgi:hypothetical protein